MKTNINRISIPIILEVGTDNLSDVGGLLNKSGFSKVVIFFGAGIQALFGEVILKSIEEIKEINVLKVYDCDSNEIHGIIDLGFSIPTQTEVIVGIGGGKVIDVAKYIGFLNNIPFISIPTSTSNDGFSSSGCSLIINGKRTSVHARMPYGIIVDIGIIKSSPDMFLYSGIGDLISKITAVQDWLFEEKAGKTIVNDFAVMISKKSVNSILRTKFESIKEDSFINELVDSLTMSGVAMEIAGNSAPASGSEHLISHALDHLLESPQLHGIQVGIATYIMSKVQEHRVQSVEKFLTETGFFNYVKTLGIKAKDYENAINHAALIKPNRHTYIHVDEHKNKAIKILYGDKILNDILN